MSGANVTIARRAQELFESHADGIRRKTDRTMAGLLAGQWLFAILLAITVSPYSWEGKTRAVHVHVWAAVVLGGAISSLPIALALFRPGASMTRYVVAVAQMLWSGLLIHLTGGRIETHFHVFGSLAFLAFYRDWRVLVPATVVVAGDHLLRQLVWPESVYGIPDPEWWRFLEHAGWVAFEDVFLVLACVRGANELKKIATTRAELEATTESESAKSRALDVALVEAITARDAAEQANQVKGQFLANMSHELRTPIGGVIGMTELMGVTELSPKQARYVDTIRTSGQTLLLVVNDILEFSKMEASKTKLETRRMNPADVARAVVDALTPQAERKGLRLTCHVAADVPPRVNGDPGRLHQVIGNIVANAVKFTETGEVSVRLSTLKASPGQCLLRFEIEDSGIGIADHDMPRLFQAFSQVDGSDSRKYGGTGLGLVIARHLVELMSGEIGVKSQPSQGSTFWFTARFAATEVDSAPVPDAAPRGLPSGARLLVAEDNPVNQEVAVEMLTQLGYSVDLVSDGEQALRAVEANDYAAVLMDCQMPIMDGYAAVAAIKKRPGGRNPPVIAVTAHALPGDREKALSAGMDDYLTKPLTLDRLDAVLQTWIKVVPRKPPLDPSATRSARVNELLVAQLDVWPDRLLAAASSGDNARVKEEAHRMKGSCVTVGATALAELCRSIEAEPGLAHARGDEVVRVVTELRAALLEERRLVVGQVQQ